MLGGWGVRGGLSPPGKDRRTPSFIPGPLLTQPDPSGLAGRMEEVTGTCHPWPAGPISDLTGSSPAGPRQARCPRVAQDRVSSLRSMSLLAGRVACGVEGQER